MGEAMDQLSIFDFPMEQQTVLQVNDKVKVLLVSEAEDSEIHNYRKYYYPHVIGKFGIVVEVKKRSILVEIDREEVLFDEKELQWIA